MRKSGPGVWLATLGAALALAVVLNVTAVASPPQASLRVYADDRLWASFSATDLNPGPAVSLDRIYVFPGTDLVPVADAGPGNPAYHGGRWEVHAVTFESGVSPTQFTDGGQVLDALAKSLASVSGPVKYFECPLLPL
jgi:hypothetical protein